MHAPMHSLYMRWLASHHSHARTATTATAPLLHATAFTRALPLPPSLPQARSTFSVSFYLVSIMYLLFDIEVGGAARRCSPCCQA